MNDYLKKYNAYFSEDKKVLYGPRFIIVFDEEKPITHFFINCDVLPDQAIDIYLDWAYIIKIEYDYELINNGLYYANKKDIFFEEKALEKYKEDVEGYIISKNNMEEKADYIFKYTREKDIPNC
jgi:hypothetical protein